VGETEALQGAAIARCFRRGNLIRHCGDPAAGTKSQRKCARALSERAKIRALPIEDFDAADMPIGVGVELDRRRRGAAAGGTSTMPVVPRIPRVASGVAIFMSPVLATRLAMKEAVPVATLNEARLPCPPS
jgi:hypothetical protein